MALSPVKKPVKDELLSATGKAQEASRTGKVYRNAPRLTAGEIGAAVTGIGKRLGKAAFDLSPPTVRNAALRTADQFDKFGVPGAAGRTLARQSSPEMRAAVLKTGADIREQGIGPTLGKSLAEASSPEMRDSALATHEMLTNFGSGLTPGREQAPDRVDVSGVFGETPATISPQSNLGSLENLNAQIAAIRGLPSTVKPRQPGQQFSVTPRQRRGLLKEFKSELEDVMDDSKRGKLTAKGTANAINALRSYYGEALGLSPQEEEAGKTLRSSTQDVNALERQKLANKGATERAAAAGTSGKFQAKELALGEDLQPTIIGFDKTTGKTIYPTQVQAALDQYLQNVQAGTSEEEARQRFQATVPGTDPRLL